MAYSIVSATDGLGDYVLVPLTQGRLTKVSPEDYEWVSQKPWRFYINKDRNKTGYAMRNSGYVDGKRGSNIFLHKEIFSRFEVFDSSLQVDHINRDSLDNRRRNLRPATNGENGRNRNMLRGVVPFVGVILKDGLYRAVICTDNIRTDLGGFDSALTASIVRDLVAIREHKEFAYLNHPIESYEGMDLESFLFEYKAKKYKSGYRGVSYSNTTNGWVAYLRIDDEHVTVHACFEDEVEAARVRDLKVLEVYGEVNQRMLNFPASDYPNLTYEGKTAEEIIEASVWANRLKKDKNVKRPGGKSKYLGVRESKRGLWGVRFNYKNKAYGYENKMNELQAAIAADRLRLEVCGKDGITKLNFPLSDYMDLVEQFNLYDYLDVA
jgi:hypothetical protein